LGRREDLPRGGRGGPQVASGRDRRRGDRRARPAVGPGGGGGGRVTARPRGEPGRAAGALRGAGRARQAAAGARGGGGGGALPQREAGLRLGPGGGRTSSGRRASTMSRVAADVLTPVQRQRRQRILKAAVELAAEGGYDAVQMREVALRADVALGTLYR